jgi:hypothetical protein
MFFENSCLAALRRTSANFPSALSGKPRRRPQIARRASMTGRGQGERCDGIVVSAGPLPAKGLHSAGGSVSSRTGVTR